MRVSSLISFIIFIILLLITGDFYYNRVYLPCSTPLPYSIGFIDPRQNITHDQLTKLLSTAETIWEKPVGRNLFQPELTGDFFSKITGRSVTVNVRYDERQLKKNILSAGEQNLDVEAKELADKKTSLELLQNQYIAQKNTYENHVSQWNNSKRTSPSTHQELQTERAILEQLRRTLDGKIASYNEDIVSYNKKVNDFNSQSNFEDEAGTTRGRRVIDLYLLAGDKSDAFLIAHELGHAIGIDGHSADENALMYYRLPKNIARIDDSDIALLTEACKW